LSSVWSGIDFGAVILRKREFPPLDFLGRGTSQSVTPPHSQ
jgi:hypothetical protein